MKRAGDEEADTEPAAKYANLKNDSLQSPEQYYDNMAKEYEATVRKWGYEMPEKISGKLLELLGSPGDRAGKHSILDCGCGDGLVGLALAKLAGTGAAPAVTGMDISSEMLALAADKKVYDALVKADLCKTLPVGDS